MLGRRILLLLLLACLLHPVGCGQTNDPALSTQEKQAVEALDVRRLQAHVRFLASDLLEGRETATRGYDIAAAYVASEFERIGLIPAGDPGRTNFLQKVPFRETELIRDDSSLELLDGEKSILLTMDQDYLMSPDYLRESTAVEADVVFAGYGVTAPELKYDDYRDIDATGKVVAILDGAPATFPNSERAHHSSSLMKEQDAVAHSAVGILYFKTPDEELRTPWERQVRRSRSRGFRWIDTNGTPHDVFAQLQCTASLGRSGAEKLFDHAQPGLQDVFELHKERKMRSFAIPARVRMKKTSRLGRAESSNVAALLVGSDPKLSKEVVVYTAHLDHLGIGAPVKGDSIYNGAYDNATGIAMLLETARALALLPVKPKRSILFLAVTAEEKGLQGADYFARHPTVPTENLVADVNLDMSLLLFPLADVVAIGGEHSSLGQISIRALKDVGLEAGPDPAPEEVVFVRSDQYPFIKQGVPSVFLVSGYRSTDTSKDGAKIVKQWMRETYHSPRMT